MYIPKKIRQLTYHERPTKDTMGMSGSRVYIYQHHVLKVHEIEDKVLTKEKDTLIWLKDRIPVPEMICYQEMKNYAFLLMSKCEGAMTCDPSVLDKPYDMVSMLAKGLKMLWKIDIHDCPFDSTLKEKLKIAQKNVEEDDVDTSQAEDNTYGEKGFKDPYELLEWLKTNQPQEELVFSHSDYCLPNVLVKDGAITGFIDFDRAGIACKWADISLCVRSIYHNFGHHEDYIKHLFNELDMSPDWDKIRYYILLDELF